MKSFSFSVALAFFVLIISCKKTGDADPPVVAPVNNFPGPLYSDNYTAISSWSNRSQWNLANVHDPTVEKSGDYFYMYQTDASYGNVHEGKGHYPYRRSKDLVNWEFIIGTDPNTPWSESAFIGLAESDDLAGNIWTDKGMVVCSEPDGVKSYIRNSGSDWEAYFKFNAIDPCFIVTPEGEHWLIYGSWHSGIAALKLNAVTGKPDKLETINDYGVRIAGRGVVNTNRWQALEA